MHDRPECRPGEPDPVAHLARLAEQPASRRRSGHRAHHQRRAGDPPRQQSLTGCSSTRRAKSGCVRIGTTAVLFAAVRLPRGFVPRYGAGVDINRRSYRYELRVLVNADNGRFLVLGCRTLRRVAQSRSSTAILCEPAKVASGLRTCSNAPEPIIPEVPPHEAGFKP